MSHVPGRRASDSPKTSIPITGTALVPQSTQPRPTRSLGQHLQARKGQLGAAAARGLRLRSSSNALLQVATLTGHSPSHVLGLRLSASGSCDGKCGLAKPPVSLAQTGKAIGVQTC
ncbi:hypothetical protein VTO73DRAFT_7765 [Trametes versicolor]